MDREKLDVNFTAKLSRHDNCSCSACHGIGRVMKIGLPETKYFDGGQLTARYRDYWICAKCRTKLAHALDWPEEE